MSPSDISKCTNAMEFIRGCDSDVDVIFAASSGSDATCASTAVAGASAGVGRDGGSQHVPGPGAATAREDSTPPSQEPTIDTLSIRLSRIKELLYADKNKSKDSISANAPTFAQNITSAIIRSQSIIFPKMIHLLSSPPPHNLPFEARKDVAAVFNYLLNSNTTVRAFTPDKGEEFMASFELHVLEHYHAIMKATLRGFDSEYTESPDTALLCGGMYRSTLRHELLYRKLLGSCAQQHQRQDAHDATNCAEAYLYPLMDKLVFVPNFDVASDALSTIREVLVPSSQQTISSVNNLQTLSIIASEFLQQNYTIIMPKLNTMLSCENYITKRLSLKLLSEILLDRSNFNVMMQYISSRDNLRQIMLLLRDPSGNIQLEAFHVFKIFVANPNKPREICKILFDNKVKLAAYLQGFHVEKERNDGQFRDEKTLLIRTLNGLDEVL